MKIFVILILLAASIFTQTPPAGGPTATSATSAVRASTATLAAAVGSSSSPSAPDASLAFDTSSSDAASVSSSSSSFIAGTAAYYYKNNGYSDANNAWSYLQRLGGGCCDNCKKICGFAIRIAGSSYYLTNFGSYFRFLSTTNPSSTQIFTLSQNADCTWSISNSGSFLSTSSIYSGTWVGTAGSVGTNERWYIERSGGIVYVQSASLQYNYWRVSAPTAYFLGYTPNWGTRFVFEYLPCDKTFGWNW